MEKEIEKEIDGFKYIIEEEDKIIGIITASNKKYSFILKPNTSSV